MTFIKTIQNLLGFKAKTLHESSIGRIYQHSQESTIGIVTAYRGDNSPEVNASLNNKLQGAIRANGFGFIKLTGHYTENQGTSEARKVVEQSFLVISNKNDNGKLKGFLRKVGFEFDQDAVIYKEPGKKAIIIGTTNGVTAKGEPRQPGLGNEFVIGDLKPNKIGDMYSKMKGNKGTFIFEGFVVPDGFITTLYKSKVNK